MNDCYAAVLCEGFHPFMDYIYPNNNGVHAVQQENLACHREFVWCGGEACSLQLLESCGINSFSERIVKTSSCKNSLVWRASDTILINYPMSLIYIYI